MFNLSLKKAALKNEIDRNNNETRKSVEAEDGFDFNHDKPLKLRFVFLFA